MPLLELVDVCRNFRSGEDCVRALEHIDLAIDAGEMVAILGASGSGKSTLLNILGCLDRPSSGCYRIDGRDTSTLGADALASLRRERFGFVFQRYHLLPGLSVLSNVELPAIYSGISAEDRRKRAQALLQRLGLGERCWAKPNELSGGQQQRVSIARALMNGVSVILADEPTGALDSQNGAATMDLLCELHRQGHTVILITHDPQVAAHASRIVELRDGRIQSDQRLLRSAESAPRQPPGELPPLGEVSSYRRLIIWTALLRMALQSLLTHRLRSALSVSGICIGVAAVASITALGDAARTSIDSQFRELLAGRLSVTRGSDDLPAQAATRGFDPGDVAAIQALAGVKSVAAAYQRDETVQFRSRSASMAIKGWGAENLAVHGLKLEQGRDFTRLDLDRKLQVTVLNQRARERLFPREGSALGRIVYIASIPFVVVGVANASDGLFPMTGWQAEAYVPATVFATKLSSDGQVNALAIRKLDFESTQFVIDQVEHVLQLRHGVRDFEIQNSDDDYQSTTQFISVLEQVLAVIAGISLMVGGVGVMNMMLVSVSERIQEIGIRLALGAPPRDVQLQFLIEATVLCAVGGLAGLLLTLAGVVAANALQHELHTALTLDALLIALALSTLIGIMFGYLPSRRASMLSPVQAISAQ